MQITQFFLKGLNKTLKLINGTNFSYAGPWTTVYTSGTVIDTWYVGDFMSADYTISVDKNSGSKEIIKCLVVASPQLAAVTIYGRTDTNGSLINLTVNVANSRVSLIARSIEGQCRLISSASYYQTISTLVPAVAPTAPAIPTYLVASNVSSVSEGGTVIFTVTTTNVVDNTMLYWVNSGSTVSADFNDTLDNGTVEIIDNFGTITRTLVEDLITEGSEDIIIEIRKNSITGELLAISTTVDIADTSNAVLPPSYSVVPSTLTMNEGETVTFTITTLNVADGTTLYWSNNGTTNGATDFASPGSNNGTFVINSGLGTIDITLVDDITTEGGENIAIKIRTSSISGPVVAQAATVTVLDTSKGILPEYTVAPNLLSVNEGNTVIFTITTLNVPDGSTLFWTNGGNTSSTDFEDLSNNGSVTIINNLGYVNRTLKSDLITEGSETIILELRTLSSLGTVVATSPTVSVTDTSTGGTSFTYSINPSASSVNEGGTINYTVATINVADGEILFWTNNGTSTGADFVDGVNSGSVTINSNAGVITRILVDDLLDEGTETISIQLRTGSLTGSVVATASTVTINDTSTIPPGTIYNVTVASGNNIYGTGNKYYIGGFSGASPTVNLVEGETYVFIQSNSSNTTHQLLFSDTANGTWGSGIEYTTGVTKVGVAGQLGAYTQITVPIGAPTLYYYCINHTGMGGTANTPGAGTPIYTSVTSPSNVNEGSILTFTVNTENVVNGTTVGYTITGIGAGDLSSGSLTGNITITSNTGTVSVTLANDLTTEGAETITLELAGTDSVSTSTGSLSSSTIVNDTSTLTSTTYSVTPATSSVNEGSSLTFNVATTGVADTTTLYWTVTNSGDFGSASDSFTISSNSGAFQVTPSADTTTEGAETFTVSVRTGSISGTEVAVSSVVTINDTSTTPAISYSVTPATSSVNEGSLLTFIVNTTGVADSTTLYWTVTNAGDFGSSSGSFTIAGNLGSFSVTPSADITTEGTETFIASVRTGSTSGTVVAISSAVTINDTSVTAFVPDYTINVSAADSNNYTLSGTDRNGSVSGLDPALAFNNGDKVSFVVNASGHPFWLKTAAVTSTGSGIPSGVTNNGTQSGTVQWTIVSSGTFYYICQFHGGMVGTISVAGY